MKGKNILIVGVGGQGVVLASNMVAGAALNAGFDVKKTDTLGMAQRGGSVISHLRYGHKIDSPLIPAGEADLLLAFEKLEAARWAHYLKPTGVAVINDLELPPLAITLGNGEYPADNELIAIFRKFTDSIYLVPATAAAEKLGNSKMVNTVLLGYAAGFLEIEPEILEKTIADALPVKLRQPNAEAFTAGNNLSPLGI